MAMSNICGNFVKPPSMTTTFLLTLKHFFDPILDINTPRIQCKATLQNKQKKSCYVLIQFIIISLFIHLLLLTES